MTDDLSSVVELADEMLELVRNTEIPARRGDGGDLFMRAAYTHGYRRLRAIRDLAANRAGAEAFILARAFVSLVARAAYVDAPTDSAERKKRFQQLRARELSETIQMIEALAKIGMGAGDISMPAEELAEIGDVGRFPKDAELMRNHLDLEFFHARVYRPGSDYVHFTLGTGLRGFRGEEEIQLDDGDAETAAEALRLAILTFGHLVWLSERSVKHGLADRIPRVVRAIDEGDESARKGE